jgi:LL-diaminopimelate aminotransferase
MVKRNAHMAQLEPSYLFVEIARKVKGHKDPKRLVRLSIGDTTEPLPECIVNPMAAQARGMGTREGYVGYGAERGMEGLRQQIAEVLYRNKLAPDEIFVSDGAKCDIGRLQLLFDSACRVAVQDPAYPAYVDTSLVAGRTIVHWPCTPENGFFPDLDRVKPAELIFFCSPANPTGAVATRAQLERLVAYAKAHRSVILFDAAYSAFVRDPAIPRSIYEIEGAREVAIEIGSFSKMIGFTGVRLGWTAVPKEICFGDGTPLHADWSRIVSTFFNGASCVAQWGGSACLTAEGRKAMEEMVTYYLGNAALLRSALQDAGLAVYGGVQAPYLWAHCPGRDSWDLFNELLETAHLVVVPGGGFGSTGRNFLRLSAFGSRHSMEEAAERLRRHPFIVS